MRDDPKTATRTHHAVHKIGFSRVVHLSYDFLIEIQQIVGQVSGGGTRHHVILEHYASM